MSDLDLENSPQDTPAEAPTTSRLMADNSPPSSNRVTEDLDVDSPDQISNSSDSLPAQTVQPVESAQEQPAMVNQNQPLTAADDAMQRNTDNLAFADDLHNGRIKPETYQDLFEKKSTLGKIGTIFGLIVSGAGSGLTHQPNALLDMMNKEIERDLEAQKASQGNKQNWYKMSMDQQRNQSLNALTQAQANEANVGAVGAGATSDIKKWEAAQMGIHDMSAASNAQNHMLIARDQMLQNSINQMPPGPARDQQQAYLDNVIRPDTQKRVMANNANAAGKAHVINTLIPNPNMSKPQMTPEKEVNLRAPVVNQNRLDAGIKAGRFNTKIPGSIPEGQVAAINQEIKDTQLNRNGLADYADSFNKLNEMKLAGQAPAAKVVGSVLSAIPFVGEGGMHAASDIKSAYERQRNTQVEALKQRIGKNMSENEKDKLADSLFPNWADTDKSRAEAFRKGVQHFQSLESTPNLDQYNLKTPFPIPKYKSMPINIEEKPRFQSRGI